jgi:hypothetical protein
MTVCAALDVVVVVVSSFQVRVPLIQLHQKYEIIINMMIITIIRRGGGGEEQENGG